MAQSVAANGKRAPWFAGIPARAASQFPQLGAAVIPRDEAFPRYEKFPEGRKYFRLWSHCVADGVEENDRHAEEEATIMSSDWAL